MCTSIVYNKWTNCSVWTVLVYLQTSSKMDCTIIIIQLACLCGVYCLSIAADTCIKKGDISVESDWKDVFSAQYEKEMVVDLNFSITYKLKDAQMIPIQILLYNTEIESVSIQ